MKRQTRIFHTNGYTTGWLNDEDLEIYLKSPNCDNGKDIAAIHVQELMTKAETKEYLKKFDVNS